MNIAGTVTVSNTSVAVECPHCGARFAKWIERKHRFEIVHCDEEFGGCGQPIVLAIPETAAISVGVYTLEDAQDAPTAQYALYDATTDILLDGCVMITPGEAVRRNDQYRRNNETCRLIPAADYYAIYDAGY